MSARGGDRGGHARAWTSPFCTRLGIPVLSLLGPSVKPGCHGLVGLTPLSFRPCPVGTQFVVTTMVGGVLVFGGLRSELPLNALQCPGQPHREWASPSARSAGLMTALVTMAPWQEADWPGSRESPGGVSVPGLVVLRGASRSALSDTSGRVFIQAGPSPRRPQTCHVVIGPMRGTVGSVGPPPPACLTRTFLGFFQASPPPRTCPLKPSEDPGTAGLFLFLRAPQGATPPPPSRLQPSPRKGPRPAVRASHPALNTEPA